MVHFLDDIIHIVPSAFSSLAALQTKFQDYINLTDVLRVPQNNEKDAHSTIVTVLGYEIDTNHFILQLP